MIHLHVGFEFVKRLVRFQNLHQPQAASTGLFLGMVI